MRATDAGRKAYDIASLREFHFSGSVQGVGFRWTAKRLAESLGITGWVRNNPDGSVTLVATGADEDVDQLLSDIMERFGPYIQEVTSRDIAAPRHNDGFEIVR